MKSSPFGFYEERVPSKEESIAKDKAVNRRRSRDLKKLKKLLAEIERQALFGLQNSDRVSLLSPSETLRSLSLDQLQRIVDHNDPFHDRSVSVYSPQSDEGAGDCGMPSSDELHRLGLS